MLQFDLSAQVRSTFGKGANRTLRRDGISPAVVYGPKSEALPLQVNTKEITRIMINLQRRNAVFTLDIAGGDDAPCKKHVMVKEVQTDPITDALVHTDFYEIALEAPITLKVPVKYTGVSKGVDLGGILNVHLRQIKVNGPVLDIPNVFEINIKNLAIGDSLCCADLDIPAGLKLLQDPSTISVEVVAPKRDRSEAGAEGEEEVKKGGKKK